MEQLSVHSPNVVQKATEALVQGGVILHPTDTVYGLGADALSEEAVSRIRTLKGVPNKHPFLMVMADYTMLEEYAELSDVARVFFTHFLPGPLSLIVKARDATRLPGTQNGTIGVRIPDHPFCLSVARSLGRPYITTSANVHGVPPCETADAVAISLTPRPGELALCVDGGTSSGTQPSTIVDVSLGKAVIVREGAVPRSAIDAVLRYTQELSIVL